MLKITEVKNQKDWDGFVDEFGGHPLQLWQWGELKATGNWQVRRIFIKNSAKNPSHKVKKYSDVVAAAQILTRKLPWPLRSIAYIPRGPFIVSSKAAEREKILNQIVKYCQKLSPKPVCLTIEPDWEEFPPNLSKKGKWRQSKNTILIAKTLIVDLKKDDNQLLSEMSKKTRQYIRKSSENISVREIKTAKNLEKCLDIYEQTAQRAGFAIHSRDYYRQLFEKMGKNSVIYGAFTSSEVSKNQPEEAESVSEQQRIIQENFGRKVPRRQTLVAFLWNVTSKKTSFELYGGVNEKGQKLRANYILKWLTIKQIQSRGVERYDMNGLLNDGISKFKAGFASHQNELAGTWDLPLSKWYFVWNKFLPFAKKIIRSVKKFRKK